MENKSKKLVKIKVQEELSILKFELLVSPSQCLKPLQDTGIDLIVVPYIPENESESDGDHVPFPYIFAVQLKSTITEKIDKEKIVIEKVHIKQWLDYNIPVLLARYYLEEGKFLFAWIDHELSYSEAENPSIPLASIDENNIKSFIKEYLENENKKSYLIAIENHILKEDCSFSKIFQKEFNLSLIKDELTRYNVDFFGLLPAKGKKKAIQNILEEIKDKATLLEKEATSPSLEISHIEYLIVFQDQKSALKIREKYEQNRKIRSIDDILITINLRWLYFDDRNLTELPFEGADNLSEEQWKEFQASLKESKQKDQIVEHSEALNQLKQLLS